LPDGGIHPQGKQLPRPKKEVPFRLTSKEDKQWKEEAFSSKTLRNQLSLQAAIELKRLEFTKSFYDNPIQAKDKNKSSDLDVTQ